MADESKEARSFREVPANEIIAKIKNGEWIDYDHVSIIGDLLVSRQLFNVG